MIKKFYAWVKTLPPPVQTLYYSVEASVIGGLTIFTASYIAAASASPPRPFLWGAEAHVLWIAVNIGLAKAIFDLLKTLGGAGPTQDPTIPKGP